MTSSRSREGVWRTWRICDIDIVNVNDVACSRARDLPNRSMTSSIHTLKRDRVLTEHHAIWIISIIFGGFLLLADDERDDFVLGGEALIGTLQHNGQRGTEDTSSVAWWPYHEVKSNAYRTKIFSGVWNDKQQRDMNYRRQRLFDGKHVRDCRGRESRRENRWGESRE